MFYTTFYAIFSLYTSKFELFCNVEHWAF